MMKEPIVIRVLVTEVVQGAANDEVAKALRVEEEIIEINYQAVEQIKVTQLLVKLDSANNELLAKREMTVIELKDSEIHNKPRSEDTHKYPDGMDLCCLTNALCVFLYRNKLYRNFKYYYLLYYIQLVIHCNYV